MTHDPRFDKYGPSRVEHDACPPADAPGEKACPRGHPVISAITDVHISGRVAALILIPATDEEVEVLPDPNLEPLALARALEQIAGHIRRASATRN